MIKWKKVLALLMVCITTTSLAACGEKENVKSSLFNKSYMYKAVQLVPSLNFGV